MESNIDDIGCLIKCAKNGDEQAMTSLITIHKGLIFTIILRMTNDYHLSEDLTQDTFIRAFMNMKKVKSGEHFRPWLCTIARNIVRDHYRRNRNSPSVSFEQVEEFQGQSDDPIRRRVVIQDALARLTERDRMLLTLTYYEGLSLREIAETMKMTEANAKVCLHRARKRLRKQLAGYENELL
ncbi:MAG: sigma-70 family RNA polymerase sigma factor [candidate division WOR-3 bacterium]|nr:MAG: sigma-70 family RNA polymerase sigma factor [candidate division WOR-3 bacterium]